MATTDSKIEKRIVALFKVYEYDEAIVEFIEENEDEYSGDLNDFAFREAIRQGVTDYIDNHVDDIDLMDNGDSSSYLDETDDEDIQSLLMSYGAYRSFDDYTDYKFSVETVNNTVLSFDSDFQQEVFEKYLSTYGLTREGIIAMFSDTALVEAFEDENERSFEEDMAAMGVTVEDGELKFLDKTDWDNNDYGMELHELVEELGWECEFEGESWKFETNGVYFIK